MEWFKNRIDAKVAIEDWRRLYNEVRPPEAGGGDGTLPSARARQYRLYSPFTPTIFQSLPSCSSAFDSARSTEVALTTSERERGPPACLACTR